MTTALAILLKYRTRLMGELIMKIKNISASAEIFLIAIFD